MKKCIKETIGMKTPSNKIYILRCNKSLSYFYFKENLYSDLRRTRYQNLFRLKLQIHISWTQESIKIYFNIEYKKSSKSVLLAKSLCLQRVILIKMAKQDDYDYLFKLVLIGDSGVGKSNILSRYTKNMFSEESRTTVGVEFASKRVLIKDKVIKIQIWDTAGQERFRSIAKAYYKGAVAALLVYDITDEQTFNNLDTWYKEINEHTTKNEIIIMLVGNKLDLEHQRKVKKEKGLEYAEQHKLAFHEVSAADGTNIDLIFTRMVDELYSLMLKASEIGSVLKTQDKQSESPTRQGKVNGKNKKSSSQGKNVVLKKDKQDEGKKKDKKCCS